MSQTDVDLIYNTIVFGLLVLLLVAANLGIRSEGWRVVAVAMTVAIGFTLTVLGLLGLVGLLFPATTHGQGGRPGPFAAEGYGLWVVGGALGVMSLFPAARTALSRVLPAFDPKNPVHAVSAALYAYVLTYLVGTQLTSDQLKAIAASGESPSLWTIIATNQLPFVVVAIFGVGFLSRRRLGDTLTRLGLIWPGWRWIAASLAVAVGLVIFGTGFDWVMTTLTPDQAASIQSVSDQLLRNVVGIGPSLILSFAAGLGEELIFRGALLPRMGNLAAAVLFAALHTQYAISLATLEILILGLALGVLRRRAGTTGAIVAHFGYDAILLLLPILAPSH